VRASCTQCPRRAADAGKAAHPSDRRMAPLPGHLTGSDCACQKSQVLVSRMGSSPSLSARHGWPRRNALSPDGVKLGVAAGAPLWIGCSSANRALTGKLLRDGIVAVPEVSGAGCLALSPVRRVRAAQPSGCFPAYPSGLRYTATHRGAQSVAAIANTWLHKSHQRASAVARGAAVQGRRA
jgi:hypothetical protein